MAKLRGSGTALDDELVRRSSDDARCVVCMSGGMPTPAASGSLARVGGALIDEPFDAEKVRRVVDERRPGRRPRAARGDVTRRASAVSPPGRRSGILGG